MSSSSRPRARVIRGARALDVRAVPFETDLNKPRTTAAVDQAVIDAATTDGYRKGLEAGRRDGYQTGMAAARDELAVADAERAVLVERALHALQQAAADLRHAQISLLDGVEDDIAEAGFAIAEAVLGRELRTAADPGRDAIARALDLVPLGDTVVHLHPDDLATLGDRAFGREVTLVADPAVERAGAIVEVGACRVDAQIGSALDRVRSILGVNA